MRISMSRSFPNKLPRASVISHLLSYEKCNRSLTLVVSQSFLNRDREGADGRVRPRESWAETLTIKTVLVLFDIDGTLLRRAGPHHRDALIHGVRKVLGVETRNDNIAVHGKLDPEILLEMMANAGISRRRARTALPAIHRAAERHYIRNVPVLRRKTCPGVRRLLGWLQRRGVLLGLVTGNLERIGWKKLERAALDQYFQFGAFAEMAPTRAGLARLALRQAAQQGGGGDRNGKGPRGVLIGDTPNDVAAGKTAGLETIAVGTGLSSIEELRTADPSLCVPDLAHPSVADWLRRWLD
jgi:phosphoglycolate phosphatase-like HAD superfamily hydrolase